MKVFVEKGYYVSREQGDKTEYQITSKGVDLFNILRDKADRDSQPVPLQYPKEFKGTKTSYY